MRLPPPEDSNQNLWGWGPGPCFWRLRRWVNVMPRTVPTAPHHACRASYFWTTVSHVDQTRRKCPGSFSIQSRLTSHFRISLHFKQLENKNKGTLLPQLNRIEWTRITITKAFSQFMFLGFTTFLDPCLIRVVVRTQKLAETIHSGINGNSGCNTSWGCGGPLPMGVTHSFTDVHSETLSAGYSLDHCMLC